MTKYDLRAEIPEEVKKELQGYPELLQKLLYYRGVADKESAEVFLNPVFERDIGDPFLLLDMKKAAERVVSAIKNNETICVYSDYDADGIPGGVVLHDLLKKIGYENFFNYIPDRHFEGYGLSVSAVEEVARGGARVVVTVDCGIVDFAPALRAKELGMDLIITDHHLPQGELPEAYAVVNPKRESDTYPDNMLCGAGMAFKLSQAILKLDRFGVPEGWEKWLLDMAGLSTIADMVPLQKENRAIAYFGLKVLRKSPRPGLLQLLRKMKVEQKSLTEDDISFMIVPRINAASRMDKPMKAFELLKTTDVNEAEVLATHLNQINDERKGVVAGMVKEIHHKNERFADKNIIVVGNPEWRPGLLGLVANSVMEHYGKSVFVWGRDGLEGIKGSCRSDGSINVVELMRETPALTEFGGHKFAGGFSVESEKIHFLEKEIELAYEKVRLEGFEEEKIEADSKLTISEINFDNYRLIEKMAPFGEGNPKPIFLLEDVFVSRVSQFGKEKNHLNVYLKDENTNKEVQAIAFFKNSNDFQKIPEVGKKVNLAAHFEKSNFRGYPELRLRIVDLY